MKRFFDLSFAILIFFPIAVFILFLAVLIRIIDGFSPFFLQERVGKGGVPFICYKLQTMRPAMDERVIGERERDWERVTKLGKFIRDHGWDELPQIVNVFSGNMSFIGPRPLLQNTYVRIMRKNPYMLSKIWSWRMKRESVLPGISGWHQILDEDECSIVDADMECFECRSFIRTARIFLATALIFLIGKGFSKKLTPTSA